MADGGRRTNLGRGHDDPAQDGQAHADGHERVGQVDEEDGAPDTAVDVLGVTVESDQQYDGEQKDKHHVAHRHQVSLVEHGTVTQHLHADNTCEKEEEQPWNILDIKLFLLCTSVG